MAASHIICLPTLLQLLPCKLMYSLQHHEPRLATNAFLLSQQALAHQRFHPVQYIYLKVTLCAAYSLYRLKRAAAYEYCKAAEQPLLLIGEQVVAPLYGSPEGLLAGGRSC